jgi:hypothetical protein
MTWYTTSFWCCTCSSAKACYCLSFVVLSDTQLSFVVLFWATVLLLPGSILFWATGPLLPGSILFWATAPVLSGSILFWATVPLLSGSILFWATGPLLSGSILFWATAPLLTGRTEEMKGNPHSNSSPGWHTTGELTNVNIVITAALRRVGSVPDVSDVCSLSGTLLPY